MIQNALHRCSNWATTEEEWDVLVERYKTTKQTSRGTLQSTRTEIKESRDTKNYSEGLYTYNVEKDSSKSKGEENSQRKDDDGQRMRVRDKNAY